MIISEATSRLAGRLNGLHYSDGGRVRLKNIADPIHIYKVYSELDAPPSTRWAWLLGKERRSLSLRLALLVTLVAAATALGVVLLTTGDSTEPSGAAPEVLGQDRASSSLASVVPDEIWRDCELLSVPRPRADETAACEPSSDMPDRWEISSYRDGDELDAAYASELAKGSRIQGSDIQRDKGQCSGLSWGGERVWVHGPGKPGGRVFCYFDANEAVIVWSHGRLNQPSHVDIMVIAREGGSDHVGLARWWSPVHHRIGKAG